MSVHAKLIALILGFVCPCAMAQQLVLGTTYGMSQGEVKALLPKAAPGTQVTLPDGSEELLRLNSARLLGHSFSASFFFRDDQLVRVGLTLKGTPASTEARIISQKVFQALRKTYGSEIDIIDRTFRLGNGESSQHSLIARWNVEKTDVDLFAMSGDTTPPMLIVSFAVPNGELFNSSPVLSTSRFYLLIADNCRSETNFCPNALFRVIDRRTCLEVRPAGRADVRYCSGTDAPCEHMGYSFRLKGLDYRVTESRWVSATDSEGGVLWSEQAQLLETKAPNPSFHRTDGNCTPSADEFVR